MTSHDTPATPDKASIGNVLYPVANVQAAAEFYEGVFSIARLFVDGDRYAALRAGNVKLALAGESEQIADVPSASFKVADVRRTLDLVIASGGEVVRGPEDGPHEVRAAARDPWGNVFIVYGPLP
ncbi:VOC family protein [Nocardia sp. NPDC050799]|uniref:VOC family protein n=1 Tax=Nocardia sp. NPDC050799 TaxID=3154842 RepID=UPI0033E2DCA3